MDNKWWIVIAIASIFVIGMFVQKSYNTFSILPAGQYNSDTACTFITNIAPTSGTWAFSDYSSQGGAGKWIAVDVNGDGTKEKFGMYSSSSGTAPNMCDSTNFKNIPYLTTVALGGFQLKYGKTATASINEAPELYVCSGNTAYGYVEGFQGAVNAITSCSVCNPMWQTGAWSNCVSGIQTRTVTDSNNCGVDTNKPSTSQACVPTICTSGQIKCATGDSSKFQNCMPNNQWSGLLTCVSGSCPSQACTPSLCNTLADTNCDTHVDRTELGVIINNWIAGSATRSDLALAINAWMVG